MIGSEVKVSSISDENTARIDDVRRKIETAMDGLDKEQCCVILAIISAECGLYDSAINLLANAKVWRESVFRAGGKR